MKLQLCYFSPDNRNVMLEVDSTELDYAVNTLVSHAGMYEGTVQKHHHRIRANVVDMEVSITPYKPRDGLSTRYIGMFLSLNRVGGDCNAQNIPHGVVGGVYIEDRKLELWSRPGELAGDLTAMVSIFR